ncbi:MAG: NapC/NirT family cytochrome c [Gammaproteobacteria bacterium]|nr:NapC/NirT family cytochrome c [Gammaproteobacteria bacterium]
MIKRLWQILWAPSSRYSIAALLIVGAIGGVVFWGGFNTFMEYTNSLSFCTGCHEMSSTVYPEYQKTIHYQNRTGVRAVCADCHVPHEWGPKLLRKIQASNELYHKIVGTINTPEKFEARRLEMAERVWTSMKATDSRECRNCHDFTAMELERQKPLARTQHENAMREKQTCIDCHKGIAHKLVQPELKSEDFMM